MRVSSRLRATIVSIAAVLLGIGFAPAADAYASAPSGPATPVVASSVAALPGGNGYWIAAPNGGVYHFGAAKNYGSAISRSIAGSIVAIASTPDGRGYWLVASGGGVYSFGDAHFYGSARGKRIVGTIVGMAPTASGHGYWLVASGGGVYSFGDARFYGSARGKRIVGSIVGMAPAAGGHGYWLVASGGGVYSFGDAPFYGSARGRRIVGAIVGIASTASGHGYRLVESGGGVYSFGDSRFYGSARGRNAVGGIVGIGALPSNRGYWLVAAGGAIYSYGNARFYGSALPFSPGSTGYDVSQYQCPDYPLHNQALLPAGSHNFSVVQITGGALTQVQAADCLQLEAAWAGPNLMAYIFMNPDPAGSLTTTAAYNYGFQEAQSWVSYARSQGISPNVWWLDIETSGSGYSTAASAQPTNAAEIEGAVAGLQGAGVLPGLYSTPYQWGRITGNLPSLPGILLWVPGAAGLNSGRDSAVAVCSGAAAADGYYAFAGGRIALVQYGYGAHGETYPVDPDYACG